MNSTIPVKHLPIKRLFDILFSSAVLVFGAPIFLLISLAITLTTGGAPLYRHQRVGRGGRSFYCYKFRTMYHNADARLSELLASDPVLQDEWQKLHKLKDDPRVTPLGRYLRKSSLDELPQFWNVLRGDLSVVGPRPVVEKELSDHFGSKAHKVLSVRPGLTGLWQVSGRSNVSYDARIHLDEQYVDTRSFWVDLCLICKTIPCLFSRRGAY